MDHQDSMVIDEDTNGEPPSKRSFNLPTTASIMDVKELQYSTEQPVSMYENTEHVYCVTSNLLVKTYKTFEHFDFDLKEISTSTFKYADLCILEGIMKTSKIDFTIIIIYISSEESQKHDIELLILTKLLKFSPKCTTLYKILKDVGFSDSPITLECIISDRQTNVHSFGWLFDFLDENFNLKYIDNRFIPSATIHPDEKKTSLLFGRNLKELEFIPKTDITCL
jgi:hypothetical protein